MSYEHLAGRLIETQRALLGRRAVAIAQSVDGLTVTDDGTVTDVADGDREVVGALVDRYADVLGRQATSRFRSAATEFEGEVVLPENLGGPAELPAADGGATDTTTGATDGTDETSRTATETDGATTGAGPATVGTDDTATGTSDGTTGATGTTGGAVDGGTEDAGDPADGERPERASDAETVVEYSTPSDTTLTGDVETAGDLASVYVVAEDRNGWQWRLTVEDAVLNAVTSATDLTVDDVGGLQEYVDSSVVEAALGNDGAVSFTFEIEGHRVTLEPDGDVHIR
jgi:hypothetical protein